MHKYELSHGCGNTIVGSLPAVMDELGSEFLP